MINVPSSKVREQQHQYNEMGLCGSKDEENPPRPEVSPEEVEEFLHVSKKNMKTMVRCIRKDVKELTNTEPGSVEFYEILGKINHINHALQRESSARLEWQDYLSTLKEGTTRR